MDPDPAVFVSDLQDINEKLSKFFCLLLFEGTYIYIIFLRLKVIKKSQNGRNQWFSYYFCLMTEGSESVSLSVSGSATLPPPPTTDNTQYRIQSKNLCFLKVTWQ
jgi:hypothetical protein